MSYIHDMYGYRSSDFIWGFLAAMETFAVYKDGERYIGCLNEKLRIAQERAVSELSEDPKAVIYFLGKEDRP